MKGNKGNLILFSSLSFLIMQAEETPITEGAPFSDRLLKAASFFPTSRKAASSKTNALKGQDEGRISEVPTNCSTSGWTVNSLHTLWSFFLSIEVF